ncbi:epoxyqueuosine reductase [Bacteroidales bacterium]|nr:epoxyqueuosine reductase [Bacteroidales bacterium]
MKPLEASEIIKQKALEIGFDACGICEASHVGNQAIFLDKYLENGYHGEMSYMAKNIEKRKDPSLLVHGAKSVVVVALNYFPAKKQDPIEPQFAYYAYADDYHELMKKKLKLLYEFIYQEIQPIEGRVFCDTAPILEKYHAQKAGLGWIGKHTQLIIPNKGSYFFLGELVIDLPLHYDLPIKNLCGTCKLCMEACPTKAIVAPKILDARSCLAYLSIEYKGEMPLIVGGKKLDMSPYIYGCDICNKICPWNKFARPTKVEEFNRSAAVLGFRANDLMQMDEEDFKQVFSRSVIKRIGLAQLKRNFNILKLNNNYDD